MKQKVIDVKKTLLEEPFWSVDIEGDGKPSQRPVEISFCLFNKGKFVEERYFLLNPGRKIGDYAQTVHGITDDMVKDAPPFSDIESKIRAMLQDTILVGHDLLNDIILLAAHIPDALLLPSAMIDTYRMARAFLPQVPGAGSLKLGSVAHALSIDSLSIPRPLPGPQPTQVLTTPGRRGWQERCWRPIFQTTTSREGFSANVLRSRFPQLAETPSKKIWRHKLWTMR